MVGLSLTPLEETIADTVVAMVTFFRSKKENRMTIYSFM